MSFFFECGFDFQSDGIFRIVNPSSAVLIEKAEPLRTNQDENSVRLAHALKNVLMKIDSDGDIVDIHEKVIGTDFGAQTVINSTSPSLRVGASIADEDLGF